MQPVTTQEMKQLEAAANAVGLSYETMMENAGSSIAQRILTENGKANTALVFCGPGNNGGDGYVIARLLAQASWRVTVVQINGQPRNALCCSRMEKAAAAGVQILPFALWHETAAAHTDASRVSVDAIYGTGFHGAMSNEACCAAQAMQRCRSVWAVDIPSGMECDTGRIAEHAVKATDTVSFHAPKFAHTLPEASAQCGNIFIADIGISAVLEN